jgi:3-deoxy-7-phosphoheptulonate synthase class II
MSVPAIVEWIQNTDLSTSIREGGLPYPIIGGVHLLSIAWFGGMLLATDLAAVDHHEGTITLIANAINWDASDERVDEAYDDAVARRPDPNRMVRGYNQAAATLNLLRAFTKGGFADLTKVHLWNQEFVASSPEGRRYEAIALEIERALRFMAACGIDLEAERNLHEVDVWTSHEGLLLDYEQGLTRRDSLTGDWYDCSAHMLWIGDRTRQLDGAHVEFFSGVRNPLGLKVGPTATADDLVDTCERLDPERTPGRLTLIARMGAGRVQDELPPLIRAVREAGHPVVWACDPMHANAFRTASGYKTRRFEDIMSEISGFFEACLAERTWPGGVHLEFTGEDVTECLGGAEEVREDQLSVRYRTLCDPRLNARQSLDLAFRLGELVQRGDRARPRLDVRVRGDDERRARCGDAAVDVGAEAERALVLDHPRAARGRRAAGVGDQHQLVHLRRERLQARAWIRVARGPDHNSSDAQSSSR